MKPDAVSSQARELERDGEAFCFAHVTRRRPSGASPTACPAWQAGFGSAEQCSAKPCPLPSSP